MARKSGKDGSISFNGQDMSGESNSWTLNVDNDVFEVTAFSDSAKTFVEGKYGWTVDVEAFFDAQDNKWDEELNSSLGGGAKAMTIIPKDNETSDGTVTYSGNVFIDTYELEVPVDGAITLSATFQGSGALTRATN